MLANEESGNGARLAVDIGGTFTDVALQLPGGRLVTTKLLTTYDHPGTAVLDGISRVIADAGIGVEAVGLIIHGTTLATNALIQRRGARTALLTTAGHRDALEIAHEDRFEQYDIMIDRPRPLVPRYLRLPVDERLDCNGKVLKPLRESDIEAAIGVLARHQIESVAIGYLHAYVNPAHERRTAELLQAALPGLSITLASEVCPEIREFERLSTACANAYVRPLMSRYLNRLAAELEQRGFHCPFLMMTSGGGLTTLETATRFPIRLVESGPAGGAILAQQIARDAQLPRLLSFDMGGTTAKLCLIDDGEPLMSRSFELDRVYRFKKGSGLPVRIPVIEMVEIGAGGGSIATIDKLGRVRVGPESAGSEPGPAAYGLGGSDATVTDADAVLGKIVAAHFAGGTLALDGASAARAITAQVGEPAGFDLDQAALAINEIVDENMAAAARAHAAEFGMDVGQRVMVAFGGAAPLHALRVGEKLGVKQIVIPADAGVGSAIGFLLAPIAYEVIRSRHQLLSRLDLALITDLLAEMRREAEAVVRAGAPSATLCETRHAYMRYVGQGHEIAVSVPLWGPGQCLEALLRGEFEAVYRRLYGHCIDGVDIEVLSWTLTVSSPAEVSRQRLGIPGKGGDVQPRRVAAQALFDPLLRRRVEAPVYLRQTLRVGQQIDGPALITESQTTTVVTSAWRAAIDPWGAIVLECKPGEQVEKH